MYNSLKCAKKLEEAGVPREQAEAHVQVISEIMEAHFATKQDLTDVKYALKEEIGALRQELKQEIGELRQELKQEVGELRQELKQEVGELRQEIVLLEQKIVQSEQRMTIKLGTIVSIAVGVAVTLARITS